MRATATEIDDGAPLRASAHPSHAPPSHPLPWAVRGFLLNDLHEHPPELPSQITIVTLSKDLIVLTWRGVVWSRLAAARDAAIPARSRDGLAWTGGKGLRKGGRVQQPYEITRYERGGLRETYLPHLLKSLQYNLG